MVRVVVLGLGLALCACGKRAPSYDRDTPEATVREFFRALNARRIPEDLDRFFIDDNEIAAWRLRCEHRGCAAGVLEKLRVVEQFDYRAVIEIDYSVRGEHGAPVMKGTASPVQLTREGGRWYIVQMGKRITVPTHAAPAQDAGG